MQSVKFGTQTTREKRCTAKRVWVVGDIGWKSRVSLVVNYLFHLIFIFPLFLGMVMYANEFKIKEKNQLK